ncbi:MAG: hypothetical protein JWQ02_4292, partial [Capsulimonas sp.]|nr:hypothetical protein [Capsulimonas sp.]
MPNKRPMEDYSIICENLTKIYKGGKKSGDSVAV